MIRPYCALHFRAVGAPALLSLHLLASPRGASAASLSFDGPSVCPDEAVVVARVEAERGRSLIDEPDVAFAAIVVRQPDGTLQLRVTTLAGDDASGSKRTLVATDCSELVAALAQVVSLVLGPPAPSSSEKRPTPEPPAETETPVETEPADPPARPEPTSGPVPMPAFALPPAPAERPWFVTALAEVDTASFGTFVGGGRLEGGRHFGRVLEARAGIGYLPVQETRVEKTDTTLAFALLSGSALGCAAWTNPVLRVPVCAGAEAGELRASHATESPRRRVWVAARLDARALFTLSPHVRLSLATSLAFPWVRPVVRVDGALAHAIPAVCPRLGAGFEWAP